MHRLYIWRPTAGDFVGISDFTVFDVSSLEYSSVACGVNCVVIGSVVLLNVGV